MDIDHDDPSADRWLADQRDEAARVDDHYATFTAAEHASARRLALATPRSREILATLNFLVPDHADTIAARVLSGHSDPLSDIPASALTLLARDVVADTLSTLAGHCYDLTRRILDATRYLAPVPTNPQPELDTRHRAPWPAAFAAVKTQAAFITDDILARVVELATRTYVDPASASRRLVDQLRHAPDHLSRSIRSAPEAFGVLRGAEPVAIPERGIAVAIDAGRAEALAGAGRLADLAHDLTASYTLASTAAMRSEAARQNLLADPIPELSHSARTALDAIQALVDYGALAASGVCIRNQPSLVVDELGHYATAFADKFDAALSTSTAAADLPIHPDEYRAFEKLQRTIAALDMAFDAAADIADELQLSQPSLRSRYAVVLDKTDHVIVRFPQKDGAADRIAVAAGARYHALASGSIKAGDYVFQITTPETRAATSGALRDIDRRFDGYLIKPGVVAAGDLGVPGLAPPSPGFDPDAIDAYSRQIQAALSRHPDIADAIANDTPITDLGLSPEQAVALIDACRQTTLAIETQRQQLLDAIEATPQAQALAL